MTDHRVVERTGERSIRTSVRRSTLSRRLAGVAVAAVVVTGALAPVDLAQAEPTSPTAPPAQVESSSPTPSAPAPSAPAPSAPAPSAATPGAATPSAALPSASTPSPTAASPTSPSPMSPNPTSASPTPPTPSATAPAPSARPTKTPGAAAPGTRNQAAEPAALTLTVGSSGGPVAGRFYQDLGSYDFQGRVTGLPDGTSVVISRRTGLTTWVPISRPTVSGGAFRALVRVTDAGTQTFRASTVISGDPNREIGSVWVKLAVADSGVKLDKPVSTIDALVNPVITGTVFPARAGVKINIEAWRNSTYQAVADTTSDGSGRFRLSLGYGNGVLAEYAVRLAYKAANSNRWEHSTDYHFTRTAVLNAKVTPTTAAEVAKTYRAGCPVGASKLRTVTMNFLGRDKRMHRGVIIIRTDLTPELIRGFGLALANRYPVEKMNNPNVYGGNDPTQMAANNTSGFNCRKVVGNPYAQSPHSYGIALDVNTVQNPYRDARGTWWPANGKTYIDRSNRRWGMLYLDSDLTGALRNDGFFWGGQWNPGRDYQHFEYTG